MKKFAFFFLILLGLVSCSKDDDTSGDDTESWEVFGILSPNGLGDLGYNDNVFYGLCMIRHDLQCRVETYTPSDFADAEAKAAEWMALPTKKNVHRLLIMCDSKCADFVKKNGWANSKNKDILVFDVHDTSLNVYTRATLLYGACYIAGRSSGQRCKTTNKHLALLLANNQDWSITEGAAGFLEGAKEEGATVDTYYLYDEQTRGYNVPDSAYHLCYQIAPTTDFIMPLAGSSNNGAYRYGRDAKKETMWICSVDEYDFNALGYQSNWISLGTGEAIRDFAKNWKEGATQSLHEVMGLESGYVMYVTTSDGQANGFYDNMETIEKEAIRKENERYFGK